MKRRRGLLVLIAFGIPFGIAACRGVMPTPVSQLVQNPRKYEGDSLVISGKVTERTGLFLTKYFMLKDDSGEIPVFTNRTMPAVGERLRIRGHVNQVVAIGDASLVVFEEDDVPARK